MKLSETPLLLRTLVNLKPVQIYGRVLFKLKSAKPKIGNFPKFISSQSTLKLILKKRSMLSYREFKFLNHVRKVEINGWNDSKAPRLWNFNAHYLDDLNSKDSDERVDEHSKLIKDWIKENPIGHGDGWHPYTLSLRIINLIKWNLRTKQFDTSAEESLVLQIRSLYSNLEYHLLGNHLFVNACALIIAGIAFDSEKGESAHWYRKGLKILDEELDEQVLVDGGHFERSPMYHALLLENLLDLISIHQSYGKQAPTKIIEKSKSMMNALEGMTHSDGNISLFNDSAMGIAPIPGELIHFAKELGLAISPENNKLISLQQFGLYKFKDEFGNTLIVDAGDIGPGYIFGHAHCDNLSFEFSTSEGRLFVNTGTSLYEIGERRTIERSTISHNTVMIDGSEQSEIWAGFRVARQARTKVHDVKCDEDSFFISCSHDGYKRLTKPVIHQRTYEYKDQKLEIRDFIDTPNSSNERLHLASYHLHPDVDIERLSELSFKLKLGDKFYLAEFSGGEVVIEDFLYAPEFGILIKSKKLTQRVKSNQNETFGCSVSVDY